MTLERGTQPYHFEEQRLREVFDKILEERLGPRLVSLLTATNLPVTYYHNSSMELTNPEDVVSTQQTPSNDITFSQSCDLDLHEQPVGSKGASSRKPVAVGDHKVLVDEEAVKQSMELSQRLSEDAIGT